MPNLHMNCCKPSVLLRTCFEFPVQCAFFFRSLYRACFHNCLGLNFRVEGIGVSVERSRQTLRFQLLMATWRSSAQNRLILGEALGSGLLQGFWIEGARSGNSQGSG